MRYFGRIVTPLIAIFIIAAWHSSYFLIAKNASYIFFIQNGFLKYDFIYAPLILPFFWWVGKKYDEAKFYSERDPLTSLYNRRFVFKVFPDLLEKVDKTTEKLRVFVVDIDNFKEINDTYGHEIGDAVIQCVANSLLQNTSQSDLVARWGGDEFLVLTFNTWHESNTSLLADIDKNFREPSGGIGINISVSIGNSVYPDNARVPNDLIRIADERMYALKLAKKGDTEVPVTRLHPQTNCVETYETMR